jgi:hypothetical protein
MGEITLQKALYTKFLGILKNIIIEWKSEKHLPEEYFNELKDAVNKLINADEYFEELKEQIAILNELISFVKKNKGNYSEKILGNLNYFRIGIIKAQKI